MKTKPVIQISLTCFFPLIFFVFTVGHTESKDNFASMMITDVAFETLLDQAENGESNAQGLVAWDYYTGYRIGRSFKKAVFWGKLAFGNGDELGGIAAANALILSEKKIEGFEILEKLIQKGSFHARMAKLHHQEVEITTFFSENQEQVEKETENYTVLHPKSIKYCRDLIEAAEVRLSNKREQYYQFIVRMNFLDFCETDTHKNFFPYLEKYLEFAIQKANEKYPLANIYLLNIFYHEEFKNFYQIYPQAKIKAFRNVVYKALNEKELPEYEKLMIWKNFYRWDQIFPHNFEQSINSSIKAIEQNRGFIFSAEEIIHDRNEDEFQKNLPVALDIGWAEYARTSYFHVQLWDNFIKDIKQSISPEEYNRFSQIPFIDILKQSRTFMSEIASKVGIYSPASLNDEGWEIFTGERDGFIDEAKAQFFFQAALEKSVKLKNKPMELVARNNLGVVFLNARNRYIKNKRLGDVYLKQASKSELGPANMLSFGGK